jgi:G:T-mismatch repair DNA endonuclease (very short patch repair protein)
MRMGGQSAALLFTLKMCQYTGMKSEDRRRAPKSEEHKRKISEALKGREVPLERRQRVSETLKGRKASPETKAKLSAQRKGKPKSEEWKRKRSESMKGNSFGKANKGRVHSAEVRAGMNKGHIGRKHSEEEKRNRAIAMAKSPAFRYKPSSLELLAQAALDRLGVEYVEHKVFMAEEGGQVVRMCPDLYIPSKDMAIEINGCFVHNCPRCFDGSAVPIYEKTVEKDKRKLRLLTQMVKRVEIIWQHEMGDIDSIMEELITSDTYVTVIPA